MEAHGRVQGLRVVESRSQHVKDLLHHFLVGTLDIAIPDDTHSFGCYGGTGFIVPEDLAGSFAQALEEKIDSIWESARERDIVYRSSKYGRWLIRGEYNLFELHPIVWAILATTLTIVSVSLCQKPPDRSLVEKYFGR